MSSIRSRYADESKRTHTLSSVDSTTHNVVYKREEIGCSKCSAADSDTLVNKKISTCLDDMRERIYYNDKLLKEWGGARIRNMIILSSVLKGEETYPYKIVNQRPRSMYYHEISHPLFGNPAQEPNGPILINGINKWMWDRIGADARRLTFIQAHKHPALGHVSEYRIPFLDVTDWQQFMRGYSNAVNCLLLLEGRTLRGMEVYDPYERDFRIYKPIASWKDLSIRANVHEQYTGKYHTSAPIKGDPTGRETTCTPCSAEESVGAEEVNTRIDTCLNNLRDRLLDGYREVMELARKIGYSDPNDLVEDMKKQPNGEAKMSSDTLALLAREHGFNVHEGSDLVVQHVLISDAMMQLLKLDDRAVYYANRASYVRTVGAMKEVRSGYNMFAMDGHAARGIKANIEVLISCILERRRRIMIGVSLDDSVIKAMIHTNATHRVVKYAKQ